MIRDPDGTNRDGNGKPQETPMTDKSTRPKPHKAWDCPCTPCQVWYKSELADCRELWERERKSMSGLLTLLANEKKKVEELESRLAAHAEREGAAAFRRALQPFADYGAACSEQPSEDVVVHVRKKVGDGPLTEVATLRVRDFLIARDILAIGKK